MFSFENRQSVDSIVLWYRRDQKLRSDCLGPMMAPYTSHISGSIIVARSVAP